MTTFDSSSVPELAYDFDKWLEHRPDLRRGRVVIPEPSSDLVTNFLREWIETLDRTLHAVKRTEVKTDESPEQRDERISRDLAAEQSEAMKLNEERYLLVAAVCQDTPSAETLRALPHRIFIAFTAYLQKRLSDPEE